jgi:hypothetical protein
MPHWRKSFADYAPFGGDHPMPRDGEREPVDNDHLLSTGNRLKHPFLLGIAISIPMWLLIVLMIYKYWPR